TRSSPRRPPKPTASRPVARLVAGKRSSARRLKDLSPCLLTAARASEYFVRARITWLQSSRFVPTGPAALFTERYTPLEVLAHFPSHEPTVWGMLESRARFDPTRPLLLSQGRVCTYGDAVTRAETIARSLHARGVSKGERVAVMAANGEAHVLLLF